MKIIPKIARLLFALGLTLMTYVIVSPEEQLIEAGIGGICLGVGATLDWGEDNE